MGNTSYREDIVERFGNASLPQNTELFLAQEKFIDAFRAQLVSISTRLGGSVANDKYHISIIKKEIEKLLEIIDINQEPLRLAVEIVKLQAELEATQMELRTSKTERENQGKRFKHNLQLEKSAFTEKLHRKVEENRRKEEEKWQSRIGELEKNATHREKNQISRFQEKVRHLEDQNEEIEHEYFRLKMDVESKSAQSQRKPKITLIANDELESKIRILRDQLEEKTKLHDASSRNLSKTLKIKFKEFERLFENRTLEKQLETTKLRNENYKKDSSIRQLNQKMSDLQRENARLSVSDIEIESLNDIIKKKDLRIRELTEKVDELSNENQELGGQHFRQLMNKK
jgi:hypothetical protein